MVVQSYSQEYFVVKDSSWAKNDTVEAQPPSEFVDSESTHSETPLSSTSIKLYRDSNDNEGYFISPRSILRMQVKREEVPWCNIYFESKAQRLNYLISEPGESWSNQVSSSCSKS